MDLCQPNHEASFYTGSLNYRNPRETASVLILPWSISQHSQDDLASSSSSPVPSPISEESPASQRSPRASPFILDVDSVISERHQVRDLFFSS